MHLTLKQQAARPPAMNAIQHQECIDACRVEFNTERPPEALAMKTPAERAPRFAPTSASPHAKTRSMTATSWSRPADVSACIKEVDEAIWPVAVMSCDRGYIDLEQKPCSPSTTRSA